MAAKHRDPGPERPRPERTLAERPLPERPLLPPPRPGRPPGRAGRIAELRARLRGGERPWHEMASLAFPGLPWPVPGWDFTVGCRVDPAALADPATIPADGAAVVRNGYRIRLVGAGAVLDGYDLRHHGVAEWHVSVEAPSCVVRNCLVTDNAQVLIDQLEGVGGLTVEDCSFDGMRDDWSPAPGPNPYVQGRDGPITVRRCAFVDLQEDAIRAHGGGLIEHNSIAGTGWQTGGHCDAIHCGARGGLVVRRNFIDWSVRPDAPAEPNNAIRVVSEFGPIDDVLIEQNVIIGTGSYVFEAGVKEDRPASGIRITDNRLLVLGVGELYPAGRPPDLVYDGNAEPPEPRAWFKVPYRDRADEEHPRPGRRCAIADHGDAIGRDGGGWSEAEITGDLALVKVRAAWATLAGLPFERIAADAAAMVEAPDQAVDDADDAVP